MRRVLIIEDDEEQVSLAMRLLRREGIAAAAAMTLAEGLERDASTDFDCVIMDAGLPDISTPYDSVARIRDFRAPVVLWTGNTDPALIKAVRNTGAAYVAKPGGDLLVEKVWSQINWRSAALDSELGQQDAQRRIQSGLQETTPVTLSLGRVFAIVGAIVVGTVSITWFVGGKVNDVNTNVSATRMDLSQYTSLSNKRQDAFEAALKEQSEATQKRIIEWTKWRWGVSRDLRNIGDTSKIPIITTE